jgi:hypothetical protein
LRSRRAAMEALLDSPAKVVSPSYVSIKLSPICARRRAIFIAVKEILSSMTTASRRH